MCHAQGAFLSLFFFNLIILVLFSFSQRKTLRLRELSDLHKAFVLQHQCSFLCPLPICPFFFLSLSSSTSNFLLGHIPSQPSQPADIRHHVIALGEVVLCTEQHPGFRLLDATSQDTQMSPKGQKHPQLRATASASPSPAGLAVKGTHVSCPCTEHCSLFNAARVP